MGAYEGVRKFFGGNLCDLARELGYRNDNICVLTGDAITLQRLFPDTYNCIMSCTHNRDDRFPIQYAQDIVASWLFEDYLVSSFSNLGRRLVLTGGDRDRILLRNSQVSSASDCVYISPTRSLKVEIMNSYTPFWKTYRRLHLRDSKYNQLCNEHGVLLCIDMSDNSFAIIDFTQNGPHARRILNHRPYGGKTAFEISLTHVAFHTLSVENIINCLDALA